MDEDKNPEDKPSPGESETTMTTTTTTTTTICLLLSSLAPIESMLLSNGKVAAEIFSYLPKCYRFLAGTSPAFRRAYQTATHNDPSTLVQYGVDNPQTLPFLLLSEEWRSKVWSLAAQYGRMSTLVWLWETSRDHHCPHHHRTVVCQMAARHGHLDCLVFLQRCGFYVGSYALRDAVCHGHLDCVRYMKEHGDIFSKARWDEATCRDAATNGHLHCLIYCHERGCPWDKSTCEWAAAKGHLNCLQYAHEHGCPWDKSTGKRAAKYGHLNCFVYARQQECPIDVGDCRAAAVKRGHLDCVEYMDANF
jgi:hypothetical protein